MGLLPSRVLVEDDPDEARVLDIEGADADRAFEALSSETARRILQTTYEEPRTPTDIREEVGTSLQNVHYHLDKLEAADLIAPAGTGYSEKGNEMTVYGPRSEAVLLFAGRNEDRSRLKSLLGRVFGLFVVLAAMSGLVALVVDYLTPNRSTDGAYSLSGQPADSGAGQGAVVETVASIDPALAFFLGGLAMLLVVGSYWYVTEVRGTL